MVKVNWHYGGVILIMGEAGLSHSAVKLVYCVAARLFEAWENFIQLIRHCSVHLRKSARYLYQLLYYRSYSYFFTHTICWLLIWNYEIKVVYRLSICRLSICRLSICWLSICRLSICRLSIIRPTQPTVRVCI